MFQNILPLSHILLGVFILENTCIRIQIHGLEKMHICDIGDVAMSHQSDELQKLAPHDKLRAKNPP